MAPGDDVTLTLSTKLLEAGWGAPGSRMCVVLGLLTVGRLRDLWPRRLASSLHGFRHALTQGLQSWGQSGSNTGEWVLREETGRYDLRLPEALGRQNIDGRAADSPRLAVDFQDHWSQEATWNNTCWAKGPLARCSWWRKTSSSPF